MPKMRLSDAHKGLLNELYGKCSRTVDDLPYTDEFEGLYVEFVARSGLIMKMHEVWNALTDCRKRGKLTRKRPPRQPKPPIEGAV